MDRTTSGVITVCLHPNIWVVITIFFSDLEFLGALKRIMAQRQNHELFYASSQSIFFLFLSIDQFCYMHLFIYL